MPEVNRPDAKRWMGRARRLFDDRANGLAEAARPAARGGFVAGAEWMRLALGVLRGTAPRGEAKFTRLGVLKYALATTAAVAVAWLCCVASLWYLLVPFAIVAFYLVEVRMVFAFPAALDGSRTPLIDSHLLLQRAAGWPRATVQVVRIASEMLFGGLRGRGFLRSWCVGCLAVLLWYEEARDAARIAW